MKKLNLLIGVLIGLMILSCSSDDNTSNLNDNETELILSKWISKNYTFYDNSNAFNRNGM